MNLSKSCAFTSFPLFDFGFLRLLSCGFFDLDELNQVFRKGDQRGGTYFQGWQTVMFLLEDQSNHGAGLVDLMLPLLLGGGFSFSFPRVCWVVVLKGCSERDGSVCALSSCFFLT